MENGLRCTNRSCLSARHAALLLALVAVLLVPFSARAAKILNAQTFKPSPHSQDLLQVMGVKVNHGYTATAFGMYNIAVNPFDPALELVGTFDLAASVSLWDHVSLGIDLPLHMHHTGPGLAGFTVGDLRTSIKAAVLRPRRYGVGIGVALDLIAPTGGEDGLTAEPGFAMQPWLILEGGNKWVFSAVNIGYLKRFETDSIGAVKIEDELAFRLGLGIRLGVPELHLILEGDFASSVNRFWDDDVTRMEIDAGLRYRFPTGLCMQLGGGFGMFQGFGSPDGRFLVSLGYMPITFKPLPPKDRDGDGLKDPVDSCPLEPEDFDGFEDEDGCPELDNDKDGIPDASDRCPREPEDADGFEDADGCPDPDNDGDGILDPNDGCPMDPEDRDGFQDEDGCPDPDNDGDGILDSVDQCPMQPEDVDNCQDEDGCPEPGNICVTEDKLVITDKIFFKTNRAEIKSVSFPLLDEIASVIIAHPEILLIEVQGHTDDRGSDRYNLQLSDKRAKAVRDYLVKRGGVDPMRLTGKGYGETSPIAGNDSEDGRALNRRVEFIIMRRAPKAP